MLNFTIDTSEVSKLAKVVSGLRDNLPRDLSRAMSFAAYDAQKRLRAETPRFIDKPTPWTTRSTFVEPATPSRLSVRLGFKDQAAKGTPAARYLQPIVAGQPRPLKRYEAQLYRSGVLRSGEYTTPTGLRPLPLNSYGNLSPSSLTRLISRVGGFGEQGYTANRSSSSRSTAKRRTLDFFVGEPGGNRRAIYARVGRGQRGFLPVLNITKQPQYSRRFPVSSIIQSEFNRRFPSVFERIVFKGK